MKGFKGLAVAVAALLISATSSNAAVTVNIWEDGNTVVAQAVGTIDLSGFEAISPASPARVGLLGNGTLRVGSSFDVNYASYSYINRNNPGVLSTGTGFSNSIAGSVFGFSFVPGANQTMSVFVQSNFVSGGSINGSATWLNRSLATVNAIPGTYTFSLPADTITVLVGQAPAPVPLPAGGALLLTALGGLAYWRKKG